MRKICRKMVTSLAGSRVLLDTVYFTAVLEDEDTRRCSEVPSAISQALVSVEKIVCRDVNDPSNLFWV